MVDPQRPACLSSVRAPYPGQARHALSGLARLEEVGSGAVWMHVHEHRHAVTVSGGFT